MGIFGKLFNTLYSILDKHYKKFIFFNILLLLFSSGILIYQKITNGYIFEKHISLSGGSIIKFQGNESLYFDIKKQLPDAIVYYNNGIISIELYSTNVTPVISLLKSYKISEDSINIEVYNPYFSKIIFNEFVKYISISIILIAIALYLRIRRKESSIAIFSTLLFDIIVTSAILSVLDFKVTALSFVGLLMILGYAIDNNIVMATNIFKESGDLKNKIRSSVKIGLLMEITTLIVLGLMMIFIQSYMIKSLATVLFVGLLADMYYYIFGNIPIYLYFNKIGQK